MELKHGVARWERDCCLQYKLGLVFISLPPSSPALIMAEVKKLCLSSSKMGAMALVRTVL